MLVEAVRHVGAELRRDHAGEGDRRGEPRVGRGLVQVARRAGARHEHDEGEAGPDGLVDRHADERQQRDEDEAAADAEGARQQPRRQAGRGEGQSSPVTRRLDRPLRTAGASEGLRKMR